MIDKTRQTELFLQKIVESISISDTMDEKARTSYRAVGEWLGDGLDQYDVSIMPQGSFNLGTVIKPISEKDDYDIDLVCLLAKGNLFRLTDSQIKNSVGDRLKEHKVYRDKLDKEGKRCWTLEYDEFHMDILPCVPKNSIFSKRDHLTQIHLTQKLAHNVYQPHYSNPEGYLEWFESRMRDTLIEAKRTSRRFLACADIEKVPTYSVKTPLQKVVQLLKRHRDIKFKDNDENAPISILITTLAAKAYSGETNLLQALTNVVEHLNDGICRINGQYIVENPAYPEENFAEKWVDCPTKAIAYFDWQKKLKADVELLNCHNLLGYHNNFCQCFGEKPVTTALNAVYPCGGSVTASATFPQHHVNITKPNRPWGDVF